MRGFCELELRRRSGRGKVKFEQKLQEDVVLLEAIKSWWKRQESYDIRDNGSSVCGYEKASTYRSFLNIRMWTG